MKKLFAGITLMLVLSVFTLADGGIPIGGRQCPPAPEPCPTSFQPEDKQPPSKPVSRGIILREIMRLFTFRFVN